VSLFARFPRLALGAILAAALMLAAIPAAADIYPDVRTPDGYLDRYGLSTDRQYGQLLISSTGCTITTPTTATLLGCATHVTSGKVRGRVTLASGATATITIGNKPGLYRATARCGKVTGVNSAAQSLQIWRKPGTAGTDAVLDGSLSGFTHTATATPIVSLTTSVDFEVTKASAALAGGNIISARVQASTGNFTCTDGQITVEKLADLEPATNPVTP
jgi:hypothetical protein